MTRHTTRTRPGRTRNGSTKWRIALAICGAYQLPEIISDDVAHEIASTIRDVPPDKWQASAHRIARRRLARELGVPARCIPVSRLRAGSIAEYERLRRQREMWQRQDHLAWVAGFDYHSRQFAIENGVCPRCGKAGEFTAAGGACDCGFGF